MRPSMGHSSIGAGCVGDIRRPIFTLSKLAEISGVSPELLLEEQFVKLECDADRVVVFSPASYCANENRRIEPVPVTRGSLDSWFGQTRKVWFGSYWTFIGNVKNCPIR